MSPKIDIPRINVNDSHNLQVKPRPRLKRGLKPKPKKLKVGKSKKKPLKNAAPQEPIMLRIRPRTKVINYDENVVEESVVMEESEGPENDPLEGDRVVENDTMPEIVTLV